VIILFIWLPLCIAVAIFANRYNRNPFGYFALSLVLSPLVGVAFVLALGPLPAALAPQPPRQPEAQPSPFDAKAWQSGVTQRMERERTLASWGALAALVLIVAAIIAQAVKPATPLPASFVNEAQTPGGMWVEELRARVLAEKGLTPKPWTYTADIVTGPVPKPRNPKTSAITR
jgi:hypothetical protein